MNSIFNSFKVLLLFLCRLRVSLKDINMQMKSSLFYVHVMNKTHSPYFVIMDAPSDLCYAPVHTAGLGAKLCAELTEPVSNPFYERIHPKV